MSVISIGDKVSFCKYSYRLFPTFTMKGNVTFRLEASENKDILFSFPKAWTPEFYPQASGLGDECGCQVMGTYSRGKFHKRT